MTLCTCSAGPPGETIGSARSTTMGFEHPRTKKAWWAGEPQSRRILVADTCRRLAIMKQRDCMLARSGPLWPEGICEREVFERKVFNKSFRDLELPEKHSM